MSNPNTRKSLLFRIRDSEDHHSWEQFAEIYAPIINRFCLWRGLDREDARDLTQDVLVIVAKAIKSFDYDPAKGAFRNWLLTVTRNEISSFVKKKNRSPKTFGNETLTNILDKQEPEKEEMDVWERDYRQQLFHWATGIVQSEFEPTTWKAFWETAVLGHKGTEVARNLELSTGAVYTAKSRVLKRLREKIATVANEWDVYSET